MSEQEIIEGRNPVLEALRAERRIYRIWLQADARGAAMQEIKTLAEQRRIPVEEMDARAMTQRSKTGHPQGVMAKVEAWRYATVEEVLAKAGKNPPFLLLLDGIEDPQNLGSLIRTAETAGAHGVIIPEHRAAGLTPAVARAAAGATEYLPVARVTNLVRTMEELKKQGLWFVGADPEGMNYWASPIDWCGPVGLVVGGEGKGISRLVREHCDALLRLPMLGRIGSLNASVAGGILMYEAVRRRLAPVVQA